MVQTATCPLCEASCGILVDTDGEHIRSVRGDEDDPFSRGYVCPKAAALADLHDDPDRVRAPLIREGSRWREVSSAQKEISGATFVDAQSAPETGRFGPTVLQGDRIGAFRDKKDEFVLATLDRARCSQLGVDLGSQSIRRGSMLSRSIKWGSCLVGTLLLIGPSMVGRAQQGAQAPRLPIVNASHMRMQPEELPNGGPVFGDPTKPGMYVTRNRFAPGQTSRPHYHDQDRWVTVIKGTWWTGEGDVFGPDKMVAIATGGMMYHPAGFHHYDGSMDDQEVIVQIMGMGPVQTIQTEVDAKGQPVAGRGGAGAAGRGGNPPGTPQR